MKWVCAANAGYYYSVISRCGGHSMYYLAYVRNGRYRGRLVITRVGIVSGVRLVGRAYWDEVNDKQYKVRVGCGEFITVNGVSKCERKIKLRSLRGANLDRVAVMFGLSMHELTSVLY